MEFSWSAWIFLVFGVELHICCYYGGTASTHFHYPEHHEHRTEAHHGQVNDKVYGVDHIPESEIKRKLFPRPLKPTDEKTNLTRYKAISDRRKAEKEKMLAYLNDNAIPLGKFLPSKSLVAGMGPTSRKATESAIPLRFETVEEGNLDEYVVNNGEGCGTCSWDTELTQIPAVNGNGNTWLPVPPWHVSVTYGISGMICSGVLISTTAVLSTSACISG